jgi:hypothetical protein
MGRQVRESYGRKQSRQSIHQYHKRHGRCVYVQHATRLHLSAFNEPRHQGEAKKDKGANEISLLTLIEAMRYDIQIVNGAANIPAACPAFTKNVLLLGGEKSQQYLKAALDTLETVLPNAQRITLPGVGHIAADNNGKPAMVANELKNFFQQ